MRDWIRAQKERLFQGFVFTAGLGSLLFLLAALTLIFWKGSQAVQWDFLISPMRAGGSEGGILYQIVGTLILILATVLFVTPVSLGTALVKTVYLSSARAVKLIHFFLHLLNGIPSVLFGLFGFFLFVKFFGWGKSWLTGGILLAMMIYPLVTLSLSEAMSRIPKETIENARALGLSHTAIIYSVLIPQSLSSFFSGILLGLARAAGETAPIMFTATIFSGATFPTGIQESPVLSLPYHILNLAQDAYQPQALQNAWGSAAVLVSLVMGLSLAALPFRLKLHEEAKSG